MNVCVNGDLAGGAISASAETTIGGIGVALRGDSVARHPPCPRIPIHCAAVTTATRRTAINGVPIVVQGDPATCGHGAVSSTGVTIVPTPVDPGVRPAAPGAPTVTAVPLALEVAWDAVRLADAYKVQWKSAGQDFDASRQAVTTGTSYTIPDLDPDTAYTVRVIATRTVAGDGPPSASATGTPRADETVLRAPGSSYTGVGGFLAFWRGDFGALPPAWFVPDVNTNLTFVRIDSPIFGGTLTVDIGPSVGSNLLPDVRTSLSLTIATAHGSVTVSGIGGSDTSEPYRWAPSNSAELQTLFNAISRRSRVAATFTFRRS